MKRFIFLLLACFSFLVLPTFAETPTESDTKIIAASDNPDLICKFANQIDSVCIRDKLCSNPAMLYITETLSKSEFASKPVNAKPEFKVGWRALKSYCDNIQDEKTQFLVSKKKKNS